MPLPANFSAWEHLQSTIQLVQNRIVRNEFRDVGDDAWELDITTPRASLRVASTLQDDDSAIMVLIRLFFFYFCLRKASDLAPPVYGIPCASYQETRVFKPQIQLFFIEDLGDVETDYAPVTGEISFRLRNYNEGTITEAQLKIFANKIKTTFGVGNGFVWRKGKIYASYTDKEKGYQLQLLVRDKAEAKKVIEAVLDVQSDTPDWDKLNYNEADTPSSKFPTLPPSKNILGKTRRLPRKRPIADVRFRHAVCHVYGLPNAVVLYDKYGYYSKSLVRD